MNSKFQCSIIGFAFVVIGVFTMTGCDQSSASTSATQPDNLANIRNVFWSPEPLTGKVKSPTDIKEAAVSDQPMPTSEAVTIAGRINAGEFVAFGKNEATFVLSQLPDEGHGDDPDHADDCPFCKRKLKNAPKAIVRFEDKDGKVIGVGADTLFGLSKDEIVLVHGLARYDEALNTVLVKADKVSRK